MLVLVSISRHADLPDTDKLSTFPSSSLTEIKLFDLLCLNGYFLDFSSWERLCILIVWESGVARTNFMKRL